MKIIIQQYLSTLKESKELDAILPDLLLSMNFQPITKPQIGVRQHGVDLATIGKDPEKNIQKLFLFVAITLYLSLLVVTNCLYLVKSHDVFLLFF